MRCKSGRQVPITRGCLSREESGCWMEGLLSTGMAVRQRRHFSDNDYRTHTSDVPPADATFRFECQISVGMAEDFRN